MSEEQLTPRQVWEREIQDYMRRINDVKIPPDLNPAMVRVVQSRLSALFEEIRPIYGKVKLSAIKAERLIYKVETKGRVGSSEASRRINGVIALESFRQTDGVSIDLFEVEMEAKTQKEEIEVLLEIIDNKRQALITFQSLFKVEAGLG